MSKALLLGLGAVGLVCGCSSEGAESSASPVPSMEAPSDVVESRVEEPPGDNCEFGGTAVHSGVDRDEDGEVRGREVTSTRYECEDEPLLESRLLITELDVGDADCPGGGTRMDRGTDANQNGELDSTEVESTDFLCNPVVGPQSRLVITPLEVGSRDCPGGGSKLVRGVDANDDGEIRGAEVESSDLICNEVQAPPILARAQELEVGDEDCPDGGVAVLTGPDTNGDGLLNDKEVTEKSLVCDEPALVITCAIPYVWSDETSGCVLERDWSDATLAGADLSSVYLAGIDFSGADLSGADLGDAELRNADLSGANLAGADLSNAGLGGTNLSGGTLDGADLTGVDLSGALLDDLLATNLAACPEVLPEGWRCPDFGASGSTLTWPGMSLAGLDLTGAELGYDDLYGLQPLGITGCPAQLPDGWVCTELGEFGTSLIGPGTDFSGLDLSNVDLSEATQLAYSSFEGTNLSGATFGAGTDLSNSGFIGAELTGTTFEDGVLLSGAVIKNTDLRGVDLSTAELSGLHAVGLLGCPAALPDGWGCYESPSGKVLAGPGADLSGVNLDGADLSAANLSDANLSYTSMEGTALAEANLAGADLYALHAHLLEGCPEALPQGYACREDVILGPYVYLPSIDLSNRQLGDLDLSGAVLAGADLRGVVLQGANFTEADLRYADLTNADLRGANFSRADLGGATVTGAMFDEATWNLTFCPDGSVSVGDQSCIPEG